jgi:hypothetical protein
MLIARLSALLIVLALIVAPQGGYVMPTGMAMAAASAFAAPMDCEDAAGGPVDCCVAQCCPALPVSVGAAGAPVASSALEPCDAKVAMVSDRAPERPPP